MCTVTRAACEPLKWIEYVSKFDEGSVKGYNEKSKEIYIFEVDISEVT